MATHLSRKPQHLASNFIHQDNNEPRAHLITSMFGALNRFISRLDAAPEEDNSGTQGAFGFQVLRNTNPDVPLDPWFDFIIGINGRTIVSKHKRINVAYGDSELMRKYRITRIRIFSRLKCATALAMRLV